MKRKIILYAAVFLLIGVTATGYFAYHEYHRKQKDVLELDATFTLSSEAIIKEFSADEKRSNAKYLDKVIAVNGIIKSVDKDEQGGYTVVLKSGEPMSTVRCTMDSLHNQEAANQKAGTNVKIKGICTGFNSDELLGSDLILNRCSILK